MEMKKIRYMTVEEQKQFDTTEKFVVLELEDNQLMFAKSIFYFDGENLKELS